MALRQQSTANPGRNLGHSGLSLPQPTCCWDKPLWTNLLLPAGGHPLSILHSVVPPEEMCYLPPRLGRAGFLISTAPCIPQTQLLPATHRAHFTPTALPATARTSCTQHTHSREESNPSCSNLPASLKLLPLPSHQQMMSARAGLDHQQLCQGRTWAQGSATTWHPLICCSCCRSLQVIIESQNHV